MVSIILFYLNSRHQRLILHGVFHPTESYQCEMGFQGPENIELKWRYIWHGNIANIIKLTNIGHTRYIIILIRMETSGFFS